MVRKTAGVDRNIEVAVAKEKWRAEQAVKDMQAQCEAIVVTGPALITRGVLVAAVLDGTTIYEAKMPVWAVVNLARAYLAVTKEHDG